MVTIKIDGREDQYSLKEVPWGELRALMQGVYPPEIIEMKMNGADGAVAGQVVDVVKAAVQAGIVLAAVAALTIR